MSLQLFRNLLCILLSILSSTLANAELTLLSVEELARLLNYPADNISVKDTTEIRNRAAVRKNRNLALSSHSYSSKDNTFATVNITVTKKGQLLTKEMIEYAKKGAAMKGGFISKVNIDNVGNGYFGLGAFGPGGSDELLMLTIPESNRDIQILVSIPGEVRLNPISGYESYLETIYNSDLLKKVILECAETVSTKIINSPSYSNKQSAVLDSNKQSVDLTKESKDNTSSGKDNRELSPTNSKLFWALGILLLLAVGVLIRAKLRKS